MYKRWLLIFSFAIAFIAIFIELLSFIYWLFQVVDPNAQILSPTSAIAMLESSFFRLIAISTPLLFIIFLLSWLIFPILKMAFKNKELTIKFGELKFHIPSKKLHMNIESINFNRAITIALIAFSTLFAVFIALYPYSPNLNPDRHQIGSDIHQYTEWLQSMTQQTFYEAVSYAFLKFKDRPLSMLLMYILMKVSGSTPSVTTMFLPAILAPLTVLAACHCTHEASFNKALVGLSAIFAATSFHITIGMLGGFLSNWMAIILSYIFIGAFIKAVERQSWLIGIFSAFTAVTVLFLHSYTWWMLMGVILTYMLITCIQKVFHRKPILFKELKIASATLIINFAANILRNFAILGGISNEPLRTAQAYSSIFNILSAWKITSETFYSHVSGALLNPIAIFSALIGALTIDMKKEKNLFLLSWPLAATPFFITGDTPIQVRIIINLPLSIFAAQGLLTIINNLWKISNNKLYKALLTVLTIAVLMLNLNYAMRIMFQLSSIKFSG